MYGIWFDELEEPSLFWKSKYIHVAKTTQQAINIVETNGIPLIIHFGYGSMAFARFMSEQKLTSDFSYRTTNEKIRNLMKNNFPSNNIQLENISLIGREIEKLVWQHDISYIEATLMYAQQINMEEESIGQIIKGNERILSKIQSEAEDLNFIEKQNRLF